MKSLNPTIPRLSGQLGLYDPTYEHDSCGVGLVAHIKGVPSRAIVEDGYTILKRMEQRAGVDLSAYASHPIEVRGRNEPLTIRVISDARTLGDALEAD